jgi:photosystem II stability/assembly factor-like uncharacterized protein
MVAAALCTLLCVAAPQAAHAGKGRWTSTGGPGDGTVVLLAIDPSAPQTLYASTFLAGVFKSVDGGAHWSLLHGGLRPGPNPAVLTLDPRDPRRIYASFQGQAEAFRSDDAGRTWTLLTGDPFDENLAGLAFAPTDASVVYASSVKGIYRSTDGGETWQLRQSQPPFRPYILSFIAVDPRRSDTVFIGSYTGLFRSQDGGATWSPSGAGFGDPHAFVKRLIFAPGRAHTLYAGTDVSGVFRSDDRGTTWRPTTLGPDAVGAQEYLGGLTLDAGGIVLRAGLSNRVTKDSQIYESGDGGATWRAVGPGASFALSTLAADPITPGLLYAGSPARGFFRSADAGAGWTPLNQGLTASAITELAADPVRAAVFYALDADHRLWRSRDGGSSWEALFDGLAPPLSVDPNRPRTLYAGSASAIAVRSFDGGHRWSRIGTSEFFCLLLDKFVIDPRAGSKVYALLHGNNGIGCHNGGGVSAILESVDGGRTWTLVPGPSVGISDLVLGASAPAGSASSGSALYRVLRFAVERSRDGGATWENASKGLDPVDQVASLAASMDSPVLYVSTFGGQVFRSGDGAASWQRVGPSPLGAAFSLALTVGPGRNAAVYGLGGGRFFRSLDGGTTWVEHSAGLRQFQITGPLVFDAPHPGRILAASADGGVLAIDLPLGP